MMQSREVCRKLYNIRRVCVRLLRCLRAGGATGTCQWLPVAPPPSGQEMRAE